MDRERKLLYAVAVMAPILEVMTLIAWEQQKRVDLPSLIAAERETIACQEHLFRAWAQCPLGQERRSKRAIVTPPETFGQNEGMD